MGKVVPFASPRVSVNSSLEEARKTILARVEEGQRSDPVPPLGSCEPVSSGERRKNILDRIDKIRHLVAEGRIEDFVFVARDVETKHFLTEVPSSYCDRTDIFAFVGVLSALKLELTERSQFAPALLLDGTVNDPYKQERPL